MSNLITLLGTPNNKELRIVQLNNPNKFLINHHSPQPANNRSRLHLKPLSSFNIKNNQHKSMIHQHMQEQHQQIMSYQTNMEKLVGLLGVMIVAADLMNKQLLNTERFVKRYLSKKKNV